MQPKLYKQKMTRNMMGIMSPSNAKRVSLNLPTSESLVHWRWSLPLRFTAYFWFSESRHSAPWIA